MILVLNAGSSSLKFRIFKRSGDTLQCIFSGQLDGFGARPGFKVHGPDGAVLTATHYAAADLADLGAAWEQLTAWLDAALDTAPEAIGHRVVHGGVLYAEPVIVTDQVMADLRQFEPLAPLHQPHNLALIEAASQRYPGATQIACFDTAFHRTQPPHVERYAIPDALHEAGIRRYGFHGLSYAHIADVLAAEHPRLAAGRVVVAHLGSGASACALSAGQSVDTSMGFSALDGLVMGTRPGHLDPTVPLHLMRAEGYDTAAVDRLLYKESGLVGLSGLSNDVRVLEESEDPKAGFALEVFAFRAAREISALTTILGGLDGLVFTAGIGEHSARVRADIGHWLGAFGIELDAAANDSHAPLISTPRSGAEVLIIPTDEEGLIARAVLALTQTR